MQNPVLLASPNFRVTPSPLKSTSISTISTGEAYVLGLASLNGSYAAMSSGSQSDPSSSSATASKRARVGDVTTCPIHIYAKQTLQKTQSLQGHEIASTSMRSVNSLAGFNGPILVSSGKDGSIKVWDERSGSHGIKLTDLGKSRALLSFDVSSDGYTVAAGSELQGDDAMVLYWDPRQPAAPLRTHSSTHSDDITVVKFSPSRTNTLLTASSDGLISLSNADEPDEDEAVINVGNWGCSISQAGWMPDGSSVWAASDMETFSTWSEELDLFQSQDIRDPCSHSGSSPWLTDYLITASSSGTGHLGVFVGSNEGDVALISNGDLLSAQSRGYWTLHQFWTTGHEGVVRSLLWDEQDQVLVTGGEDGKIHIWPGPCTTTDRGAAGGLDGRIQEDVSMDVDMEPTNADSGRSAKRTREREMEWIADNKDDNTSTTKKRFKR